MAVEALAAVKVRHTAVTAWAACCKFGGHGDRHVLIAHCRATRRYLEAAYPAETWGILAVSKTSGHAADTEMWAGTGVNEGGWINSYVCIPNPAWHDMVAAVRTVADIVFDVQYVVGTYVQNDRFLATWREGVQRMAPFASYYSRFPLSNNELALRFPIDQWAMMSRTCPVQVTPADMHAPCELPPITLKAPPAQSRARDFVQRMAGCVVIHAGQGGSHGRKLPHPDVWRAVAAAAGECGATPVQVGIPSEPAILGAVDARGLSIAETGYLVKHARLVVAAEGFMAYVARAVGTRALVWFGPTSATLFAFGREVDADGQVIFPGHINWSNNRCEACWWHVDGWDKKPCPRGHPYCANLPSASDAEAATAWAIQGLAAETVPASEQSVVESDGGTTEPVAPATRKENGAMGEQERSDDEGAGRRPENAAEALLRQAKALEASDARGGTPSEDEERWTCRRTLADAERADMERRHGRVEPATPEQAKALDEMLSENAQMARAALDDAAGIVREAAVGHYGDRALVAAIGEVRRVANGGEARLVTAHALDVLEAAGKAEKARQGDALAEGAKVATDTFAEGAAKAAAKLAEFGEAAKEARQAAEREPWEAPDDGAQVHLVMTTYGRRELLIRTLRSLGALTQRPATLWLLDDGAMEGGANSSAVIGELLAIHVETKIRVGAYIYGGSRVGQAGQLNRGFALARDAVRQSRWLNRAYMVKLEDDLEFTAGWLRRLIYVWEHPDAALLNLGMLGGAYGEPGKHLPVGREQVKLTHHVGAWCMFAPLTMWEDYLPIPPRPRADAQGGKPPTASSADWYINRTGRRSVLAQGRQCACLGVVKHSGTAEGDSTWKR